jgi:short-subunit dehydrogenase
MLTTKKGAGRTALVTGASGGIGLELSRLLAADGYDLVLVARDLGKLQEIASGLEREHGIHVAVRASDLSEAGAANALWRDLTSAHVVVDVLVNNAGVGIYGEVWQQESEALQRMLVLNMESLTLLTRYALPGMIERRSGRILNVASIVAYQPGGPRMAAYYASKAYVLSFTKGLAVELRGTGVTVTALCPGLTRTGFMQRAGATSSVLEQTSGSQPDTVAKEGYNGLMRGRTVVIPGLSAKLLALAGEMPPRWIALAVNERLLRRA